MDIKKKKKYFYRKPFELKQNVVNVLHAILDINGKIL